MESMCIVDFCGYTHPGHFPVSFWADYWPTQRVTTFGGDWADIPDMPSDSEPTDEAVTQWVKQHGGEEQEPFNYGGTD